MSNVWNPNTGRWEDTGGPDATGNVLIGGQGAADGTWQGGVWQNPQGQQFINGQWVTPGQPQQTPAQGQFIAQQGVNTANQNYINSQGNVISAQQGVIPLQQQQIGAQRNANNAQAGVLNAQAQTFPIQQQQIAANGQVINAQAAQTQAQVGFIGQQQQSNNAAIIDLGAIQSAKLNQGDRLAVNDAQNSFNNLRSRYADAGVAMPEQTYTNDNSFGAISGHPGQFAVPRTQEARVTESANFRSQQRALDLKTASYIVDLAGTNVDAARQAAARVGLTLDQANLIVSQAKNAAGYADIAASNAGLNVNQGRLVVDQAQIGQSQAQLGLSQANQNLKLSEQPPFAGAVKVIDPITGSFTSWGTQAQADQAKYQYQVYQNKAQENLGANPTLGPGYGPGGIALVGLSQAQMLSGVRSGDIPPQAVENELVRRYNAGLSGGLNPQAAHELVMQAQEGSSGSPTIKPPAFGGGSTTSPSGTGVIVPYNNASDALYGPPQ